MLKPTIRTLVGKIATLEPLTEAHRDELREIANDPAIWTFMATTALADNFDVWFDKARRGQQANEQIPYVVRDNLSQKVVGSSRFYSIELAQRRLNIGYTWFHPSVWGTKINIESKYLMLCFAFEILNVNRVEFMADARNTRSLAAIKKIGGIQEGILRKHMVLNDNYVRDTVVFSIIQAEWPQVKAELTSKLI